MVNANLLMQQKSGLQIANQRAAKRKAIFQKFAKNSSGSDYRQPEASKKFKCI